MAYVAKTDPTSKAIARCLEAKEIATDFVTPYWDRGERLYKLFRGELSNELQVTHTQIFLFLAYALVQDLLARDIMATFGSDEWLRLESKTPEWDWMSDMASSWLRHKCRQLNLRNSLVQTYQQMHVFGTAYRHVSSSWDAVDVIEDQPQGMVMGIPTGWNQTRRQELRWRLTDQPLDFFSVYPLPNGGMVNPIDNDMESACDGVGVALWMPDDELERLAASGVFNGEEVAKCLEHKPRDDWFEDKYKSALRRARVENQGFPGWFNRLTNSKEQRKRRRIMRWYFRDAWHFVCDDKYLVYSGPGLPNGMIPIAKYMASEDMGNWFGIGTLETVEELILSRNLMSNLGLDYSAMSVHPTRFVGQQLVRANPTLDNFGPEPDKEVIVPASIKPSDAVYYDRMPPMSQDLQVADARLENFFKIISGHGDAVSGQQSGSQLAYGKVGNQIAAQEQGNARNSLRQMQLEYGGLHDELRLMLVNGSLYMDKEDAVRVQTSGGHPWQDIDPAAIIDGYDIILSGTRELESRRVMLAQILQFYPLLAQDPYVRNPVELRKQIARMFGNSFEKLDVLFGEPEMPMAPPGQAEEGTGEPGVMDGLNMTRSAMAGR